MGLPYPRLHSFAADTTEKRISHRKQNSDSGPRVRCPFLNQLGPPLLAGAVRAVILESGDVFIIVILMFLQGQIANV